MNPITRWDPLKEMEELQNRMATLFGRAPVRKEANKKAMTTADRAPLVDIAEDEKEYVIKAELPEVTKDDVKVNLQEGVLTITGERKFEKEEKGKKYHRVERAYGSFARSFFIARRRRPDEGTSRVQRRRPEGTPAEVREGEVQEHRREGRIVRESSS